MKKFIFTYLKIGLSSVWKSKEEALLYMEELHSKHQNLYKEEVEFLKSNDVYNDSFAWSECIIYTYQLESE